MPEGQLVSAPAVEEVLPAKKQRHVDPALRVEQTTVSVPEVLKVGVEPPDHVVPDIQLTVCAPAFVSSKVKADTDPEAETLLVAKVVVPVRVA